MLTSDDDEYYRALFWKQRYDDREGKPWPELQQTADRTTTIVRDLTQSLVANNDRIGGEELQTLYHLCQNTDDGKSVAERRERIRNLDLPADDIDRITDQIKGPMGSVGSAMRDPNLKVGDPAGDDTDGAVHLLDCFERLISNVDPVDESELLDAVSDLVTIDFQRVQSGRMSPILHYLAPEVFPIINSRSVDGMVQCFDADISNDLSDYLDERETYLSIRDEFGFDPHFRDLDWFLNWVSHDDNPWTAVARQGKSRHYWQAQPGSRNSEHPKVLWPRWQEENVISMSVGYGPVASIDSPEEMGGVGQTLVYRMSPGDIVAAKAGHWNLLGIGVVTDGGYEYRTTDEGKIDVSNQGSSSTHQDIRHVEWIFTLPVEDWINIEDWEISTQFDNRAVISYSCFHELRYKLSDHLGDEILDELEELERRSLSFLSESNPEPRDVPEQTDSDPEGGGDTDDLIGETPSEKPARGNEIIRQLEAKNQVVFYGPPGTGKTHIAREFAKWWVTKQTDGTPEAMQVQSVTFHPAFAYEDFLEGLEADATDNGSVDYGIEDGILKRISRRARQAKDAADGNPPPYVLIIDEINRGNLAQIFGETITLLEADKRDSYTTQLAHSDDEFTIPSNLYVIGTMNTADRSIALVDAALRRRFRFLHFPPDYDVLLEKHSFDDWDTLETEMANADDPIRTLLALSICGLKHINEQIVDAPNLSKGQQIGHSYLYDVDTTQEILDAWRFDILPLLEEYYFGQFDRIRRQLFGGAGDEVIDWDAERIRPFTEKDLTTFLSELVGADVTYTPTMSTTDGGSTPSQTGTPTYPELLSEVHQEVFDQVGELLKTNTMEETNYNPDLERTTLALQSRHPQHPPGSELRYAFQPKTHLDDPRIRIGVYATEEFREAVDVDFQQIISDSNLSERFEYADKTYATVEATWPVETESEGIGALDGEALREAISEQLLQTVIDSFVELIEAIHPAVIEAETPTQ
jgi:DNA polymerase III delta prime subunit